MKYKVRCKSLLLQKALEEFLKDYLDDDGKVISDFDGDFIIGKDIKKPFSKSQLLLKLEEISYYKKSQREIDVEVKMKPNARLKVQSSKIKKVSKIDKVSFEKKLDKLIDEFSNNLKHLIKEEYGKK